MNWATLAAMSGRNVHVVGMASTEGAAILGFLWSEGFRTLTVHDFLEGDALRAAFRRLHVGIPQPQRDEAWESLARLPVTRCFGDAYLTGIDAAEAIFVGQGWYLYGPNFPVLDNARRRGVPFHSLTELYFGLSSARILAVTGSNGKSTTSKLAAAMLTASGGTVHFAGNERRSVQVLDQLRDSRPTDHLVLEVSNRQLIDLAPSPAVGVVTNILPNHLDEHGGSFAQYVEVKRNLLRNQTALQAAVLNADDAASRDVAPGLPGRVFWFSRTSTPDRGAFLADGEILLCDGAHTASAGPMSSSPLAGVHNESNVLAAALAAWLAGATPDGIALGLEGFQPLRHRLQRVWSAAGVTYWDDLNSTTPQATVAALNTVAGRVIWIAGGEDKGLDLDELMRAAAPCRLILVLPGTGSARLLDALGSLAVAPPFAACDDLREAVSIAIAAAEPGDAILLSPAFPGVFSRHYTDAGGGFVALLRELTRQIPSTEEVGPNG